MSSYYHNPALTMLKRRVRMVSVLLVFGFVVLIARMWYLQILHGKDYKAKSQKQRIRIQRVLSPRGEFLDREGRVLVDTKPGFNVTLTLEDVKDLNATLSRFSKLLDIPLDECLKTIQAARSNGIRKFQPIRLLSNVDWKTVALLEAHQMELGGISVSPEPLRNYRYNALVAHAFGYMGEINQEELRRESYADYRMGDVIGKTGLERELEKYLKGADGQRQVEVNSLGRIIQETAEQPPEPGNRIRLTIDYDLQKALEDAFGESAGAGVVLNPNNGEILAIASRPAYDPNLFSGGIPKGLWKELINHPKHPLTNKTASGQYPPGSVFKIVLAVAGLEEKAISPHETTYCRGYVAFGGRRYHCWRRQGHGQVDFFKALVQSCDVYFYELGQRLGIDKIAEYATNMGLGQKTGIMLDGEKAGLIPSRAWKQRVRGNPWYPGETLSAAIGQGYILVTPLQIANLLAAVANGGTLYRPHLAHSIYDYRGNLIEEYNPEVIHDVPIAGQTLNHVRHALENVVSHKKGTGGRSRVKGVRVAGKTGTAQVVRMKQDELPGKEVPEKFRDHALFAAFAPVDNPEIVVAIVVEHGGHGGSAAAPIAGEVLKTYFEKTAGVVEVAGSQEE
ncbi:MAG: penicillin-binding protein 2 [bacterium]|nr:penicillin-binding protein 2 [bacterium]